MMFVAPIGRRSFFLLNVLVVLARVETMHADVLDSLKVRFHLLLNVKGGKVVSEGDEKKKSRDQIDGPSRSRGVDARGRAPFAVLLVVHPLHQVTLLNPLAKKL
jgi:hypothetical protein